MKQITTSFGTTKNGEAATLYTFTNKNGMSVSFTDYGANIVNICVPDKNGNIRLLTNDGREKKFSKAEISSMDAKALIAAKCFVELIIFQKVHTTDAGAIYLCELAETGGLIAIFIGNNQAADFELSTAEEDCFEGFVQRMHDENGAPSVYDYNTEGGTNKTVRYYMLPTASQQN